MHGGSHVKVRSPKIRAVSRAKFGRRPRRGFFSGVFTVITGLLRLSPCILLRTFGRSMDALLHVQRLSRPQMRGGSHLQMALPVAGAASRARSARLPRLAATIRPSKSGSLVSSSNCGNRSSTRGSLIEKSSAKVGELGRSTRKSPHVSVPSSMCASPLSHNSANWRFRGRGALRECLAAAVEAKHGGEVPAFR